MGSDTLQTHMFVRDEVSSVHTKTHTTQSRAGMRNCWFTYDQFRDIGFRLSVSQ